jgi:L-asparaginase
MKALILNLGGTIGMVRGGKGLRPPASDSEFRKAVEGVTQGYPSVDFAFETLSTKDSTDLTPADWEAFSARLLSAQTGYDFILCPHGTDTMAQTAMAVTHGFLAQNAAGEIVNTQRRPVIFTGAQHPIATPESDGIANLQSAIETGIKAAREKAADVLLAFHGRVMRGVNSRKVSDVALDAYHSIDGAYVDAALSGVRRVKAALDTGSWKPLNKFRLPGQAYIETLLLQPGISGASLRNIARDPACLGAILVVLGAGNVPDTLTEAVREAAQNYHFPMFAASPFPGGNANPGAYEAGSRAFEAGVSFLGDKAPSLAYVQAHWVLANGLASNAPDFSRALQQSWVGETRGTSVQSPAPLLVPPRDPAQAFAARLKPI